ncbi:MAG: hypothetical protein NC543_01560 [bacterium]|nr:hypothetical protein [bacterium]MCM1376410.1 hypothetical protein [Muribaculum sp.]
MISAASAATLFLLVGGMAAAMNYGGGLIRVRDNGFSITSENAEAVDSGGDQRQYPLSKVRSRAVGAEPVEQCDVHEIQAQEYESLEEFNERSGIIIPLPDLQLVGGDEAKQYIRVLDNQVYLRIQDDDQERYFSLVQMDHRNDLSYAAASSYSGTVANERNYTTAQGYTYKVIDLMEGDELISIECAISLYGRDILAGFYGYTQEEAYAVLRSIDLGIYISN